MKAPTVIVTEGDNALVVDMSALPKDHPRRFAMLALQGLLQEHLAQHGELSPEDADRYAMQAGQCAELFAELQTAGLFKGRASREG